MSTRIRWAIIVGCGLLGGALGLLREIAEPSKHPGRPASPEQPRTAEERLSPLLQAQGPSETDPRKAFKAASLFPSQLHQRFAAFEASEAVSTDELRALLTEFQKNPEEKEYATMLIEAWAEKDPEAAAKFLKDDSDLMLRTSLAVAWARQDAAAALAWTRRMPPDDQRLLLHAVLEGDLESSHPNPRAILDEIRRQASGNTADGNAAARPGALSGRDSAGDYLARWAYQDPAAAQAYARSLPPGERDAAMISVLMRTEADDPVAALDIFRQIDFADEDIRHWRTVSLAGALAGVDVEKAMALAETEPEGLKRSSALVNIAKGLLERHPEDALAVIDSIPLADSSVLKEYFRVLSERDPVAALQQCARRLDQLDPASAAARELMGQFDGQLTGTQQIAYARAIAPVLAADPNPSRQRTLIGFVQKWADVDPTAAATWVQSLPAGSARENAMIGTAQAQVKQGATEAVEWLKTLPASDYSAAVEGFASGAFRQDPDGALAWLRTIPDPAERARRLVAAWHRWGNSGADRYGVARKAADQWRDTSPELTPAERALLVRRKE